MSFGLIVSIFWYFPENFRLFRFVSKQFLFRFYTETASFCVSIELKQTEDQLDQFDREHILVFLVVSVCFETVWLFQYSFERQKQSESNKQKIWCRETY
jgi:hypothetical protein